MSLASRFAFACALTLSAGTANAEAHALPDGFDGDYVPDGAPCDVQNAISVRNGIIVGAEFAITVTDLIEDPVDPRKVEATLLNEGGGGEWTDSAVITLSEDGQELSWDYPDGTSMAWLRCPRKY